LNGAVSKTTVADRRLTATIETMKAEIVAPKRVE
jgi:hypothetical protein